MSTAAGLRLPHWLALLAGLAASACSLSSDKRGPVTTAAPAMSRVALDLEDASVGAQEHPRLVQGFGGVYRDARLEAVLNAIVADLVPASERPDLRYQVTVLNSPSVNAFALPGGYLYVTRGLLVLANDESEIAAVLAHEMAHVAARHAAQREEKARSAVLASRVVAEMMKDQRAGAVALAASQVSLAGFSRQQELEADGAGIATVARAGYDPGAAARFLVNMGRQADIDQQRLSGDRKDQSFQATHPTTPERIERAASLAKVAARPARARALDRNRYLSVLDGVLYGDDAKQGYARGRSFVHAELGFAFEAPEGFTLENSPRAVFGIGRSGEAMRFDGARVTGSGPPTELVASGWIEGAEVKDVRPLIIDGLPGATALAQVGDWTFRLGAVRRGDMIYRFVLGTKSFSPDTDRQFLDTIRSFRRVGQEDRVTARPLRLRSIQVSPGDTVASLARRMEVDGDKAERFLVLNGLRPGQALQPGSFVKIVAEGDDPRAL